MKYFYIIFYCMMSLNTLAQIPEGFVDVKKIIPDLDVDLRYLGSNNFIGKQVKGYNKNILYLTDQAAVALKLVQEELKKQNLCLRVYDGYRPQRAVNYFVLWAKDLNDTINKQIYYPNVDKRNLFNEGYIAFKSGHSKGSTIDLTIIDCSTGKSLDMGSLYDFFGKQSSVNYRGISKEQKANRELLQKVMLRYGFKNYPGEWWHFTLINEPFPKTYFDFPVE